MELLDFKMPPFVRTSFTSKNTKEKWEKNIEKARKCYSILEVESVKYGIRKVATQYIHISNYQIFSENLHKKGLLFFPIKKAESSSKEYFQWDKNPNEVMDNKLFGIISNSMEDALAFKEVLSATELDHKQIGNFLGYPTCCRNFFHEQWQAKKIIDTIWQQAENTDNKYKKINKKNFIKISSKNLPFATNVILRPLGIRIIPHIPCSLDCLSTKNLANEFLTLANELSLEGIEEIQELLSMPVEWDALKGIAVISTPVFKAEYNSISCYPKYIIQREGSFFPEEAPNALKFPWNERFKILSS